MSKKQSIILCAALWAVIIGLVIGCFVKPHKATAEEIQAAAVTAIRPEKEEPIIVAIIPPQIEEPTTEEESDADTDYHPADSGSTVDTDREEEIYEDYQYEEETEVHTAEATTGEYTFTEDEIWEMTRIVYLENGIVEESTDTTLYLTACVILNRLYDWDECSTVYEVIWQGGQYSTANRYEDYGGGALGSYEEGWNRSYAAVCAAIENCDRNPHFQSTFAQGTVYYVDPYTGEVFCY